MNQPRILQETSRWLVLFKPAGWLTIPGRSGPGVPVLLEWARRQSASEILTVHRLDLETSGVVLFAKSAEDHRTANRWFSAHEVKKNYDCLATGVPALPVFRIKKPIEGSSCVTQVEVKESWDEGFLARITPVTGRRHQIRIHLAGEGHPLWGDLRYGGPASVRLRGGTVAVPRVALHASRLELPSGEVFETSWPEDFSGWILALREGGRRRG